jgi:hypothetical protein
MIQITAQMRVLVAIEPVDGRKGIDSLARLRQEKVAEDPTGVLAMALTSQMLVSEHIRRTFDAKVKPLTDSLSPFFRLLIV